MTAAENATATPHRLPAHCSRCRVQFADLDPLEPQMLKRCLRHCRPLKDAPLCDAPLSKELDMRTKTLVGDNLLVRVVLAR